MKTKVFSQLSAMLQVGFLHLQKIAGKHPVVDDEFLNWLLTLHGQRAIRTGVEQFWRAVLDIYSEYKLRTGDKIAQPIGRVKICTVGETLTLPPTTGQKTLAVASDLSTGYIDPNF